MTASWTHRSEPRSIRPFYSVADCETILRDTKIRLKPYTQLTEDRKYDLEEEEALTISPELRFVIPPVSDWLPAGLDPAQVSLLVFASNAFLMNSVVIHSQPLSENIPEIVHCSEDVIEEVGGVSGFEISFGICLSENLAPVPGLPNIRGHWLALDKFQFTTKSSGGSFKIDTRTDQEWVAAGYPEKTLYSVDYIGGMADVAEAGRAIAQVWFHTDAYSRLTEESNRVSQCLQPLVLAEITLDILDQSLDEWSSLDDVDQRSPLASVLKKLGLKGGAGVKQLSAQLRGAGRSKIKAVLQDQYGLVRTIVEN